MPTARERQIWRHRALEVIHGRVLELQAQAPEVDLVEALRLRSIADPPDDLRTYDKFVQWTLAIADYPLIIAGKLPHEFDATAPLFAHD